MGLRQGGVSDPMARSAKTLWVSVGGIAIHALEAGQGEPVVLLHAEPGDSSDFAEVIPHLGETYHVVAPDLRGHGRSGKPRGDYSVPAQASHLLGFLDTAGIDRANLVGNSYGGILAAFLAAEAPARVARLVLTGIAAYGSYRLPAAARILSSSAGRLIAGVVPRQLLQRAYLRQFDDPSAVSGDRLDALWDCLGDADARWCLWKQAHELDFGLLERRLARIAQPTLLVWGRRDRATPVGWAEALQRDLPDARLEIIERCGHYPPIERPAEFARLTVDFLAATSART